MSLASKFSGLILAAAVGTSATAQDIRFGMAELRAIDAVKSYNACMNDENIQAKHKRLTEEYQARANLVMTTNSALEDHYYEQLDIYRQAKKEYFDQNGISQTIEEYWDQYAAADSYSADRVLIDAERTAYEIVMTDKFELDTGFIEPSRDNYNYLFIDLDHPENLARYCTKEVNFNVEKNEEVIRQIIRDHGAEAYLEATGTELPSIGAPE